MGIIFALIHKDQNFSVGLNMFVILEINRRLLSSCYECVAITLCQLISAAAHSWPNFTAAS